MRAKSLIVLGVVFLCAFLGRAAVLASAFAEGGVAKASGADSDKACINGALAETLKKELEALETRETMIAEEERTTEVLAGQIEKRIADLEALNKSLVATLDEKAAARDEDVRRVAAIYEQMKPQLAGDIVGGMDPDFAAGLLLAMSGESASAIMATLDADKAYAITVLMAGAAVRHQKAG